MPKFSLRRLLVIVTLIACGLGFLRALYRHLTEFETAEHVAHVDWLPESASDISYYKSYSFTAFEFDIPEPHFQAWAVDRCSARYVQPITDPVEVQRYCLAADPATGFKPKFQGTEWEQRDQEIARHRTVIVKGLYYSRRRPNGGGVTLAYDRLRGRAYFQSSPR